MTELEQYKKAYAALVGRIGAIITNLENIDKSFTMDHATASFAKGALTAALQAAESHFMDATPEEK